MESNGKKKKAFEPYTFTPPIIAFIFAFIWFYVLIKEMLNSIRLDSFNYGYFIFAAIGLFPLAFSIIGFKNAIYTQLIYSKGTKTKGTIIELERHRRNQRDYYELYFKCTNEIGTESYTKQNLPRDIYYKLKNLKYDNIPVLLYKGNALLDKYSLELPVYTNLFKEDDEYKYE